MSIPLNDDELEAWLTTPEIEAEWETEIAVRVATYERGEVELHAAEEVFAEAGRMAR